MDKLKGVAKGGWHPGGDKAIHRDSWKSDIKGIATGKTPDKEALDSARNHQSRPLSALKDPETFGPPPKHSGAAPSASTTPTPPTRPSRPVGGLGSPVPAPRWRQEEQEEEKPKPPPVPYRTDTTGLQTDNLPAPPVRRVAPAPAPPARGSAPASSVLPTRSQQQFTPPQPRPQPQPSLPPRMNDHPDEYTPPPPPSYTDATQRAQADPAALNVGAINRLGQAGVSVPGLGIGNDTSHSSNQPQQPPSTQGHPSQLSELQQRFARMNAGSDGQPSQPSALLTSSAAVAAAAHKKPPPPPPPPKKAGLADGSGSRPSTADDSNAPPLPLSSKPRPG